MPFESPDLGRLLLQIGNTMTAQRQQQEQIDLKKQEFQANLQARADALKMQERTLKMREEQFRITTEQSQQRIGVSERQTDVAEGQLTLGQRNASRLEETSVLQNELTREKINQLRNPQTGESVQDTLGLTSRLFKLSGDMAKSEKARQFQQAVSGASGEIKTLLAGFGGPRDMQEERNKLQFEIDTNLALSPGTPGRVAAEQKISMYDKFRSENPQLFEAPSAQERMGVLPPVLQQAYQALQVGQAGQGAQSFLHQIEDNESQFGLAMKDFHQNKNPGMILSMMRGLTVKNGQIDTEKLIMLGETLQKDYGMSVEEFTDLLPQLNSQ